MANVDRQRPPNAALMPATPEKITRGHPPKTRRKNMMTGNHFNTSRIHRFHNVHSPLKDGSDDEDL